MSSSPIQPTSPKQTTYEIASTAPRLSLRKCIDKFADFLKVHDIFWAGIELEPTTANGQLSPGTGPSVPAGKVLRVYIYDSEDLVANQIKQIKRLATSYFNLSTILRLPADAGQIRLNTDEEVIAQHRIPSGPHSHEQSPKHLSRQA
ncbi:hypothetical protein P167DRAFT_604086 [Morchella conica CCBAS932]|uniref:Uncharacterized protein n=1 Tax=Morchella conica CCBAS932 TaxID=1392247 RepID=A0A3N4L9H0_9PEZI|nr:hypothetical protein P167DRAFT_604086 [Morchella conica CCBAS932]